MYEVAAAPATPRRVPWHHRVAARVVLHGLSCCRSALLSIRLPDGSTVQCGAPEAAQRVTLIVKKWRFFWRVLTRHDIGVGESYMDGEWESTDLVALCRVFLHEQSILVSRTAWSLWSRIRHALQWRLQANSLRGSRRNIRYHYDLSNALYRLFLDDSMMYSCAVFEPQSASLEAAQFRKLDEICRRLELQPGMSILEIGCGWGAFAMHAASRYGCKVTGITLSNEQLELARERVAAAGLQHLIELRLCDYRKIDGQYDRIASIEMFEAVGFEYYSAYFSAVARALKPGGRMFLQTITIPDQRFDRYRRELDWIKKYIFPGGLLASLHGITSTLKKESDLRIDWLRDIGLHYARTLACWRERFQQHLPDVRALGFDERFIRMWELYLASCEAAFSAHHIGDAQMILVKPAADSGV